MENQFTFAEDGQEIQQEDLDEIAENAALAGDRTLYELLQTGVGSSTPPKIVIPYSGTPIPALASGITPGALVQQAGASGSIRVLPFRAVIGSTVTIPTIEGMRGIRSGYFIDPTNLYGTLVLAANTSGNPRYDLIYAAVVPADVIASDVRYVKDPITQVPSAQVLALGRRVVVAVSVSTGAPAATPSKPVVPVDGFGTYYMPLAYVYVPDGFGASSVVERHHIHEVAPIVRPGQTLRPANSHHEVGGAVDVNMSAAPGFRNQAYLPSTQVGQESRIIKLFLAGSGGSHVSGDVVDDSVDWRLRDFVCHFRCADGNFGSSRQLSLAATPVEDGQPISSTTGGTAVGQSYANAPSGSSYAGAVVLHFAGSNFTAATNGTSFYLYVDMATGELKINITGDPAVEVVIWLHATAPYHNYGT